MAGVEMATNYIKEINEVKDAEGVVITPSYSVATKYKPAYGSYVKESADDNRDVLVDGLWYPTSGGELVTNGTFDSGLTTGYNAFNDETLSANTNVLVISGVGTGGGNFANTVISGLIAGEEYTVKLTMVALSAQYNYIGLGDSISILPSEWIISGDTSLIEYTFTFTYNGVDNVLWFGSDSASSSSWDNISVYKPQPIIGTAYDPQLTYASKDGKLLEVEVQDGVPVDTAYNEYAPDLVRKTIMVDNLVTKKNVKIVDFGTVFIGNRYVIDNPFGNENAKGCSVRAEIFYNGMWGEASWIYIAASYGTRAHATTDEGIVVQTGNTGVNVNSTYSGSPFNSTGFATSAPCRVLVTYIGEAS